MALFGQCYQIQYGAMGGAWWARTDLPTEGGVEDQPARVMRGLDIVASIAQDELAESMKRSRRKKKKSDGRKRSRHQGQGEESHEG